MTDAKRQLLYGDGWPSVQVLAWETEADQADGVRWVDVRMDEKGDELDPEWGGGEVLLEDYVAPAPATIDVKIT